MGLVLGKWKCLKKLTEEKLDGIVSRLEASVKKSLCLWTFTGLAEVHLTLVSSCKSSSISVQVMK
jgi:hypothetical protein